MEALTGPFSLVWRVSYDNVFDVARTLDHPPVRSAMGIFTSQARNHYRNLLPSLLAVYQQARSRVRHDFDGCFLAITPIHSFPLRCLRRLGGTTVKHQVAPSTLGDGLCLLCIRNLHVIPLLILWLWYKATNWLPISTERCAKEGQVEEVVHAEHTLLEDDHVAL